MKKWRDKNVDQPTMKKPPFYCYDVSISVSSTATISSSLSKVNEILLHHQFGSLEYLPSRLVPIFLQSKRDATLMTTARSTGGWVCNGA